ncbi:MAG: hypothetical protein V1910_00410 [bacterium]
MNKSAKYFLLLFLIFILLIIVYKYKQYILDKNFNLIVNTSCNLNEENCFISDCKPESDSDCKLTPYKKVIISAKIAPACLGEHNCIDFLCKDKTACSLIYCSNETLEEGEICANQ